MTTAGEHKAWTVIMGSRLRGNDQERVLMDWLRVPLTRVSETVALVI
jgi:hypothetical protein